MMSTHTLLVMHPSALVSPASMARTAEYQVAVELVADGTVSLPAPGWRETRLTVLAEIAARNGNRVALWHEETSPRADELGLGPYRQVISGEITPDFDTKGITIDVRLVALHKTVRRSRVYRVPIRDRTLIVVDPDLDDEVRPGLTARNLARRLLTPVAATLLLVTASPWGLVGADLERVMRACGIQPALEAQPRPEDHVPF